MQSNAIIEISDEWAGHNIFSAQDMSEAVQEMPLIDTDFQSPTMTCYSETIVEQIYLTGFPTFEQIKLYSDEKYYMAIACRV
jgi:cephalosporin hydroxylase